MSQPETRNLKTEQIACIGLSRRLRRQTELESLCDYMDNCVYIRTESMHEASI